MKLLQLTIRNFRVIRKADLLFPDQVIGITGPNGAGKSSIVEAVAWALYGARAARSGKEEIKSTYAATDDDCAVGLEFEIGQEHYRLERRLVGRTERTEVSLHRNGSRESSGTIETEKHVAQLLGLDWRGFQTSFLARQQELNALASLTPVDRRNQLAGMLGIDRLDRAIQSAKADRSAAERGASVLQQQMAVVDDIRGRLAQIGEHVVLLENQHVTLEGAWQELARRLAETETESKEHEAKLKACSQARVRLDAARLAEQNLSQQLKDLDARQNRLELARKELDSIEPQLSLLGGFQTELEEVKKRREAASKFQQLSDQATAWRNELEQAEQAWRSCTVEREKLEKDRAAIPADLSDRIKQTEARLEESRRCWTDLKGELAAEEKSVGQLKEQLESIKQVGPDAVCERCRRPFGEDLPRIQTHLAAELTDVEAGCGRIRNDLARLHDEGKSIKSDADRLIKLNQEWVELELKERNLQSRLADFESRRARLTVQMQQLSEQLRLLGAVDFDPNRLKELTDQVARLERLRNRSLELNGELKAAPELEASKATLSEQRERAAIEIQASEREVLSIGFDQAAHDVVTARLVSEQAAANEARVALGEAAKELEFARREIRLKEEELKRLAEIGRQLEIVRTDQFYAEKLVNLFGDFRKFTISRIRPRLSELSSQLMGEMSGGRYSLVELDEDYNLQVMDGGAYFGIERFSGGEKDLASLCLRLSISLALTESAGLDRSFIILDEVFGSQDTGRRDLIFEALANLKKRFPQMILITHLEELKNKVETIIEVVPLAGGWSEVRVNGGLV